MAECTQKIDRKKLQSILFMMLEDFDTLCRKNHIQYFLGGGTLLGAIRHGGFIPWDDDIDLMMTRENYDRLCSLPSEAFPSHLFLQTCQSDPEYHGDMAKIRLNGTQYITEFSSHFPQMHQGIFIDIFAHDFTANKKISQKIHRFLTAFARSMVFHKWEGSPMQYYDRHKIACKLCTWLIRRIPISYLQAFREAVYHMFSQNGHLYLYDGMGMHLQHGVFPADWLEEAVLVKFEDHLFPVPKKYDEYLTYSYGNYHKIPDFKDQKSHKILKIDFGIYDIQKLTDQIIINY